MSLKLKILISAMAGVAVGLAMVGIHYYQQASAAKLTSEFNEGLEDHGPLPDFALVERDGSTVTLDQLRGKVWVADFVFTHCAGPCPLLSSKMAQLQEAVSEFDDVRLVSFSVDPERDTPTVLTEYAERYRADPARWLFLTGPKDPLYKLVGRGFLLAVDGEGPDGGSITHSTRLVLVDGDGHIRRYYDGAEPGTIDKIIPDIRSLLSE